MRTLRGTLVLIFLNIFPATSMCDGIGLRHLVGGVTNTLEIDEEYWYQGAGDQLLVLERRTGKKISQIQLTNQRGGGVCTDLIVHDGTLWAIVDGKEVVELSISRSGEPTMLSRSSKTQLGIAPRHFAMVEHEPVVFGVGGAVMLLDGKQIVECNSEVTGIASTKGRGFLYAVDHMLYEVTSGEYVGSVDLLASFDERANVDLGTLVYALDLGNRTEIGLIIPESSDLETSIHPLILEGGSASMHTIGNRVHVCTDVGVSILGVAKRELRLLKTIDIDGAKDVGVIASNYLAICGDHGREIYRISDDYGGEGDTHFRQVPATSAMNRGHSDGSGVLIPSDTGVLLYEYGRTIDESTEVDLVVDPNPKEIAVLGWSTGVDIENGNMFIRDSVGTKVEGLHIPHVSTVVAIHGNYWFGTGSSIVVCGTDASGAMKQLGEISIAGPIVQLIAQDDGSVAFVSAVGFVGVVEPTYDVAFEQ